MKGAYWIPEGVEEIEPGALIGCQIGTLHVPWTAHVHEHDQLVFSEDEEENEIQMPPVYFWTKAYSCRDDETWAFEDEGEYRVDEHGVGYSLDGHRLLFVRHRFKDSEYIVPSTKNCASTSMRRHRSIGILSSEKRKSTPFLNFSTIIKL